MQSLTPEFNPTRLIVLSELPEAEKETFFRFLISTKAHFHQSKNGDFLADVRLVAPKRSTELNRSPSGPNSLSPRPPGATPPMSPQERLARCLSSTPQGSGNRHMNFEVDVPAWQTFSRAYALLNNPEDATPRPRSEAWVMRLIEGIYDARYLYDTLDLQGNDDSLSVVTPPERIENIFPVFVVQHLSSKFGLSSIVDQTVVDLLFNVHQSLSLHCSLFRRFLSETLDQDDLLFALFVRQTIQTQLKVTFLSQWKETSGSIKLGGGSQISLSQRDCIIIAQIVFGTEQEELRRKFLKELKMKFQMPNSNEKRWRVAGINYISAAAEFYHDTRPEDPEISIESIESQQAQEKSQGEMILAPGKVSDAAAASDGARTGVPFPDDDELTVGAVDSVQDIAVPPPDPGIIPISNQSAANATTSVDGAGVNALLNNAEIQNYMKAISEDRMGVEDLAKLLAQQLQVNNPGCGPPAAIPTPAPTLVDNPTGPPSPERNRLQEFAPPPGPPPKDTPPFKVVPPQVSALKEAQPLELLHPSSLPQLRPPGPPPQDVQHGPAQIPGVDAGALAPNSQGPIPDPALTSSRQGPIPDPVLCSQVPPPPPPPPPRVISSQEPSSSKTAAPRKFSPPQVVPPPPPPGSTGVPRGLPPHGQVALSKPPPMDASRGSSMKRSRASSRSLSPPSRKPPPSPLERSRESTRSRSPSPSRKPPPPPMDRSRESSCSHSPSFSRGLQRSLSRSREGSCSPPKPLVSLDRSHGGRGSSSPSPSRYLHSTSKERRGRSGSRPSSPSQKPPAVPGEKPREGSRSRSPSFYTGTASNPDGRLHEGSGSSLKPVVSVEQNRGSPRSRSPSPTRRPPPPPMDKSREGSVSLSPSLPFRAPPPPPRGRSRESSASLSKPLVPTGDRPHESFQSPSTANLATAPETFPTQSSGLASPRKPSPPPLLSPASDDGFEPSVTKDQELQQDSPPSRPHYVSPVQVPTVIEARGDKHDDLLNAEAHGLQKYQEDDPMKEKVSHPPPNMPFVSPVNVSNATKERFEHRQDQDQVAIAPKCYVQNESPIPKQQVNSMDSKQQCPEEVPGKVNPPSEKQPGTEPGSDPMLMGTQFVEDSGNTEEFSDRASLSISDITFSEMGQSIDGKDDESSVEPCMPKSEVDHVSVENTKQTNPSTESENDEGNKIREESQNEPKFEVPLSGENVKSFEKIMSEKGELEREIENEDNKMEKQAPTATLGEMQQSHLRKTEVESNSFDTEDQGHKQLQSNSDPSSAFGLGNHESGKGGMDEAERNASERTNSSSVPNTVVNQGEKVENNEGKAHNIPCVLDESNTSSHPDIEDMQDFNLTPTSAITTPAESPFSPIFLKQGLSPMPLPTEEKKHQEGEDDEREAKVTTAGNLIQADGKDKQEKQQEPKRVLDLQDIKTQLGKKSESQRSPFSQGLASRFFKLRTSARTISPPSRDPSASSSRSSISEDCKAGSDSLRGKVKQELLSSFFKTPTTITPAKSFGSPLFDEDQKASAVGSITDGLVPDDQECISRQNEMGEAPMVSSNPDTNSNDKGSEPQLGTSNLGVLHNKTDENVSSLPPQTDTPGNPEQNASSVPAHMDIPNKGTLKNKKPEITVQINSPSKVDDKEIEDARAAIDSLGELPEQEAKAHDERVTSLKLEHEKSMRKIEQKRFEKQKELESVSEDDKEKRKSLEELKKFEEEQMKAMVTVKEELDQAVKVQTAFKAIMKFRALHKQAEARKSTPTSSGKEDQSGLISPPTIGNIREHDALLEAAAAANTLQELHAKQEKAQEQLLTSLKIEHDRQHSALQRKLQLRRMAKQKQLAESQHLDEDAKKKTMEDIKRSEREAVKELANNQAKEMQQILGMQPALKMMLKLRHVRERLSPGSKKSPKGDDSVTSNISEASEKNSENQIKTPEKETQPTPDSESTLREPDGQEKLNPEPTTPQSDTKENSDSEKIQSSLELGGTSSKSRPSSRPLLDIEVITNPEEQDEDEESHASITEVQSESDGERNRDPSLSSTASEEEDLNGLMTNPPANGTTVESTGNRTGIGRPEMISKSTSERLPAQRERGRSTSLKFSKSLKLGKPGIFDADRDSRSPPRSPDSKSPGFEKDDKPSVPPEPEPEPEMPDPLETLDADTIATVKRCSKNFVTFGMGRFSDVNNPTKDTLKDFLIQELENEILHSDLSSEIGKGLDGVIAGKAAAFMDKNSKPKCKSECCVRCALMLVERGDTEASLLSLQEALRINPNNVNALIAMAKIIANTNSISKKQEAAQLYQKAVEIEPENVQALEQLASLSVVMGMHEEAVKLFEKALALDPKNADTWYNLGSTHWKLKNYSDALQSFKTAAGLNPSKDRFQQAALAVQSEMERSS